jgi:hypothetical protein
MTLAAHSTAAYAGLALGRGACFGGQRIREYSLRTNAARELDSGP